MLARYYLIELLSFSFALQWFIATDWFYRMQTVLYSIFGN